MSKSRKAIAALTLAALPVIGLLGGAGAAEARPIKGTPTAKGCPVVHEDANGNVVGVEYVRPGTTFGLFTCGADGEWHFGWLVNAW